ncbi:phosphodiester glycosidase family protein [Rossellomorea sp. RS05]|uniref:phosphodiester glycosidase family protein n=1 Tax=Rossellomorea sp. RS05 TaxID=3149166 RepID=UPI00322199E4
MEITRQIPITLDFRRPTKIPVPTVKQFDSNRLVFTVLDEGETADLSSIDRIIFNLERPDGHIYSYDIEAVKNVVEYDLSKRDMEVAGICKINIQLYEGNRRLSSIQMRLDVAKNLGADLETSEGMTLLQEIFVEVSDLAVEAQSAATYAKNQGDYAKEQAEKAGDLEGVKDEVVAAAAEAKTQGDYAKEQADLSAEQYERLKGTDVGTLSAQLADRATKEELDRKVSQIVSGSPKGTYSTLAMLQAAKPSGDAGVYVVSADGKWYYWNNAAWTAGGVYQAVGISDNSITPNKTTFVENKFTLTFERGSLSSGIPTGETSRNRIRSVETFKHSKSITITRKNPNVLYGVSTYDNGKYDGIDRGWLDNNVFIVEPNKEVRINLQKKNGADFTDEDIINLAKEFEISYIFTASDKFATEMNTNEILKLKNSLKDVQNKTIVLGTNDFMGGSFEKGIAYEIKDKPTRIVTRKRYRVNKDDVVKFHKNAGMYSYGISLMDENGVWNGIDYGWKTDASFVVPHNGYIAFNMRYLDNRIIEGTTFNDISDKPLSVSTLLQTYLDDQLKTINTSIANNAKSNAISSILVSYERKNGASYVFVRIPKFTFDGLKLVPKVKLTSKDESLNGQKLSSLRYSKEKNTIFTLNAGLFDMTNMVPVGQTIIDGKSLINTPMVNDNGVPIHPEECYPLAIDKDDNLTTYPRNVDTQTMINDGVKYAITGWGRLVTNFMVDKTEIDKEIVHGGTKKYIRQSIGQFQNGDYCVCSVDMSRGSTVNEAGLLYEELAQILVDKGVKFAYSLDGGGSTQAVLGKRQLNPIYEGLEGRPVPTVITFELS